MSRLVPAGELPAIFYVASSYGGIACCYAERVGDVVRVSCMRHTVWLALDQRVQVLT